MEPNIRPKVGLLPTGHSYYWSQFPGLKALSLAMNERLSSLLQQYADVVACDMADTPERALLAGQLLKQQQVDLVVIFPLVYTPSMNVLPALRGVEVPLRLLNAHEDASYDYANADTTEYLHHEGVCCIPEIAAALKSTGRDFRVRTGFFGDGRLQKELAEDCIGAATARFFREMNVGLIGQVYTHMTDMPIDEHRLLRATGRMLVRPEVEEIENAYLGVTDAQLSNMYEQFRDMYDVDVSVTNEHLRFAAQTAVAFDEVVHRHDLHAFGFYWWGERELMTQLRAQAGLAVSRLAALGRPGVTEGDVKSAIAMKVLDLMGGGGMFVEFFCMDFEQNVVLLGHDGPSNISVAKRRPRLTHLSVHHGKSGHGLGIDFDIAEGQVTLLNLAQCQADDTFRLIYTIAEVVSGPVLRIGNPNCRVRLSRPIHDFMERWCQQGPSHHIALGLGDHSGALETFAEAMDFGVVRI